MEVTKNSPSCIKEENKESELVEVQDVVYVQDDHSEECTREEASIFNSEPGPNSLASMNASDVTPLNSDFLTNLEESQCNEIADFEPSLMEVDPISIESLKGTPSKNLKKKMYICSFKDCNKEFGKNSRLLLHERIHTGERPHVCPYEGCQSAYTRQFHLTRHIALSHSEQNQIQTRVDCEKCGRSYSNVYALKKHYRIHEEERFTCLTCGQMFKRAQHLLTHSYKHTQIPPYKCNYDGCEKRFLVPSKLKRHQQVHMEGRYGCQHPLCEEIFNTYSEMIHHSSVTHKKVCIICQKEFHMMCRLKKHLETHQNLEEFYFCPFSPCDCYYLNEDDLLCHAQKEHEKQFGCVCTVCGTWFRTQQKLQAHTKQEHSIPKPEKKRRPKKYRTSRKFFNAGYLCGISNFSVPEDAIKEESALGTSVYLEPKEESARQVESENVSFPEVLIKEEKEEWTASRYDSDENPHL